MGMADANKRIDLAAPLPSVRRHGGMRAEATATALPSYKADATSGPPGHTGAVPFGWERRPGHPKSVRTRRPPPPPPKTLVDEASVATRAPTLVVVAAARGHADEERFSDARDALSRDDMSCLTVNCSVTGLSDAAEAAPGVRGSVMMDRFLPAAHAVAVGSPQCTFRKAGSAREPARPAAAKARAGDGDKLPVRRLPLQRILTNHLPSLSPDDSNDDDADSDAHSTRDFVSKRCGLLPTRCVKSTFLLLNPAPAMRRGRGARRGAGRPFLSNGVRSQREMDPLLRRSPNERKQLQHSGEHDPGMQSWEELYVKSLLQSGRFDPTASAATVASELDRTVRELYRNRGAEAVHPKASHLGLLLVLDRSSEERHGSSARNLSEAGETALLLPPPKSSRNAGNKLRRASDSTGYGVPLLLEDKEPVAGREIMLSSQPPLPLPLPMSPSESWLSRALPSVSNRSPATSFLGLHVHSKKNAPLPWCSIEPTKVIDHARQR
ncbi:uncharacterized protein LOC133883935 [Phragmites australis]|uniref:uncharacterized protein LOC133883935 n=1 Tax=Phragmites australis TaxID=29695 RepID=UPI002D76E8E1|nr:uncharacterized protein LOC133883935 [Phragmites australis]